MYREENGQVVLSMSRLEYERLIETFAMASCWLMYQDGEGCCHCRLLTQRMLTLFNRLNEGNPNFAPYRVDSQPKPRSG